MKDRILLAFLFVLIAILGIVSSGCGGGGGGGGIGSNGVSPTTDLVTEPLGKVWSYSVTGTATPVAGGAPENVTGTCNSEVVSTNLPGTATPALELAFESNITIINGQGSFEIPYYVEQDNSTNSLYEVGEAEADLAGGENTIVLSPSLANSEVFPGTFFQGETVTKTFECANGGAPFAVTYSALVQAPLEVSTPAGQFPTWPLQVIVTGDADGLTSGTEDWDPALGFFVSANLNIKNIAINSINGGTVRFNLSLNYTLTSTGA